MSTPTTHRHRIAGWWHAYTRRPWEFLQAAIMSFAGLVDLFGARPFPPEVGLSAPLFVWRIYGLYLAVGSLLVAAAILCRLAPWARRAERTGMILVAAAVTVSGSLYTHWLLVQAEHGAAGDAVAIVITRYLAILMFLTAFGAIARWRFLGQVPPPLPGDD